MQYPEATVQSQYAASPTIRALVDGFNAAVDPRADIKLFYDRIFNPATAQGVGLDIWARIVGVERNIFVDDLSENFGFFVSGTPAAETYEIPSAVQALPGHGWSAGDVYNYIDFDRKVFVQRVASVDMGSLTWTYQSGTGTDRWYSQGITSTAKAPASADDKGNILCALYATDTFNRLTTHVEDKVISIGTNKNIQIYDSAKMSMTRAAFEASLSGVMLYYELNTPVETDISSYLSTLPELAIEPDTSMSFPNANGTSYQIPVPSEITYMEDGEVVTDNTEAYQKTVGDAQGDVTVNMVGGKTLVMNQQASTFSGIRGTVTTSGDIITYTVTTAANNDAGNRILSDYFPSPIGHKFYVRADLFVSDEKYVYLRVAEDVTPYTASISNYRQLVPANAWTTMQAIVETTDQNSAGKVRYIILYTRISTVGATMSVRNAMCIDLTRMFGEGNEPSTVEELRAILPADSYDYNSGTLLSAGVTEFAYFKKASQEWQPWDQGVFYEPGTVNRGSYRIDDNAFRKFIFWKALANISTSDCYTLNRLLSKLFDSPVIVTETGVMQIRMTATKALEDWQKAVLMQYGLFGKPCGVGYEFWTIETPVLGLVPDGENYMPLGQAPIYSGVMQREIGG